MNFPFYFLSPAGTASLALCLSITASATAFGADHREAPSLTMYHSTEVKVCPEVIEPPLLVQVQVPARVLQGNVIGVTTQTKNSEDSSVDGQDFLVWQRAFGNSLPMVFDAGDQQYVQGFLKVPAIEGEPYIAKFYFLSLVEGKSCELQTRIDGLKDQTYVISWSSGAPETHVP